MPFHADGTPTLLDNFLTGRPVIALDTQDLTWRNATETEAPAGLSASELKDVVGSYVLLDDVLYALFLTPDRKRFIFLSSDGARVELDPLGHAEIDTSKDLAGRTESDHNLFQMFDRHGQLQYRLRYCSKRFRELFNADHMGGFSPQSQAGDLTLADWDFFHNVAAAFTDAKNLQEEPVKNGTARPQLRCAVGEPCPQTGFWFTPARANSRTHFEAGQTMPDTGSSYGTTIWQWDEQQ